MISKYSFGMIEIDGQVYDKDVIIFPDGSVCHPWLRKAGHVLTIADIQPALDSAPSSLVVGSGNQGLMKPDSDFVQTIESRSIMLTILPTAQAIHIYNSLSAQGQRCVGCFHLTC